MSSLTCPNCGKDNPDFLDDCQFCQTALRRESTFNIGDSPTKKSTGELEPVLPDWLRDARQQARSLAEEDAAREAIRPKVEKEEPPDLLAGLAFQAASDEEEVPDWLSAINPLAENNSPVSSKPAEEQPSDFFAQFNSPRADSAVSPQEELPSWMAGITADSQKDILSDSFSQSSGQPAEPFAFGQVPSQGDSNISGAPFTQGPVPSTSSEDLSWLHNLEASANQPSMPEPKGDAGWMPNIPAVSNSQEDLGWLNNLGGVSNEPTQQQSSSEDLGWLNNLGGVPLSTEPAASTPPASQEDLGWLNNPGAVPLSDESAQSIPSSSQEDLSWLNNLGGTSLPGEPMASSQPASSSEDLSWLDNLAGTSIPSEPVPSTPAASEDLSWLNNLGGTALPGETEMSTPVAPQEDLSWLNDLGGAPLSDEPASAPPVPILDTSAPPHFSPARTAPLSEDAMQEYMPDWLKSATTEESSMPPLGATSMDWFTAHEKPAHQQPVSSSPASRGESSFQTPGQTHDIPAPDRKELPLPSGDFAPISSQDVDALFDVDMPDMLSQQPEAEPLELSNQANSLAQPGDDLAPVNLPSWVQAMRPVDAAIGEFFSNSADQTVEKDGPLAGFQSILPIAPIGSAQRPKAISLKLQASDEQQATASLLEKIIESEATVHSLKAPSFVLSQRVLRWALSGIFFLALGFILATGSQIMPVFVSAPQMAEINGMANTILSMPDGASILVVMDYEPSLSGEMEAATGPLLDQMVVLKHPALSFLSTSPNGTALVERLLSNTKINRPAPDGLGYQAGNQYFNLGYLTGGLAGVRGFIEQPKSVIPVVNVNQFSDFAAVVVLTDQAESGMAWIEQVELAKQSNPALAAQPLLLVASAQAGPLLQPYVLSGQVTGMINGISDGARYEFVNNSRPGIVRSYWDAFGAGLMLAVVSILFGSLWNLFAGANARRVEAGRG